MNAKQRIRQIRRLLPRRELIYVGPRGEDALPLASLGLLGAAFSFIAPAKSGISETCIETISNVRVDLNCYSLDDDRSGPGTQFRQGLFARLSQPSAVIPYAPLRILSEAWLTGRETVLPLGLFYEQQSCFDYKPWVESELKKWGIGTIPWAYVRGGLSGIADSLDHDAPLVVRWPRSRGGAGIWLIRCREDLESVIASPSGERLLCVAPYFDTAVSVNVNACVFPDGEVSIHGSSVQMVGIDICTPRPLGYVGNDFALIADLPKRTLRELDSMTRSLGIWLSRHGYLGAFGFDALVLGNRVLFVEINPRFQASSAVASWLDAAIGRPDQYLNHIAAFLGLRTADRLSLPEVVQRQEPRSQVVVYNSRTVPVVLQQTPGLEKRRIRLLPAPGVAIAPQGILASILWDGRVTATGHDLQSEAESDVRKVLKCFLPVEPSGHSEMPESG